MDNKQIEEIYNQTFGGLALFYRDTTLSDDLISKYTVGQILTERGFTDMSYKGGGLATNFRYLIASANGKDLSAFNADSAEFGHILLKSGAFFKVLDIYKIGDKTQVFLLEIPETAVDFFAGTTSNIEEYVAKKARESFDIHCNAEPIPELQIQKWKQRIELPIGMSDKGELFYQPDDKKPISTNNKIEESENTLQQIKSALFGVTVGDALGVPVEFTSRQTMKQHPVTDMIGYGTYNLPPGTWSDDSSLTFCLAEALTNDFDLAIIGQNFVQWNNDNFWTPRGSVFDIGGATRQAIDRLAKGERPEAAGGFDESSNGNGSLMRILPLLFYLLDKPVNERYEITKQVSSITHRHIRSVIACFYYLEFARQLFMQKDKFEVYKDLQTEIIGYLTALSINPAEVRLFDRLLQHNIYELTDESIMSDGYVLHTLEASIWCLLTTDNYKDAVLKAVNLGEDTDTTGAVTGGLAGLLYGFDTIPTDWITQIARKDDIENLAERLGDAIASR